MTFVFKVNRLMETQEHFYTEDPTQGPADVKTTLKDVNYYFLGNGLIQAVIQVCTDDEGTPLGVLLMNPEKFGPKRDALTFDPENGLQATMVFFVCEGKSFYPAPKNLQSKWTEIEGIPAVEVLWQENDISVMEDFYFPDRQSPRLVRNLRFQNLSTTEKTISIRTGVKEQFVEKEYTLKAREQQSLFVEYQIIRSFVSLGIVDGEKTHISESAKHYWQNTPQCDFSSDILNHLFTLSKNQLQASISQTGFMDASIWQYNLEWVRDQANVVMGLTVSGQFELAGTMLDRMLRKFVTDDGDTVDSGKTRPPEETELDQNGVLLLALRTYVDWTGDIELVKQYWQKICSVAEFPLKDVFVHAPSGLLHNVREYWERHAAYGVVDGVELAYQMYVSIGLDCAACLARIIDKEETALKWEKAAGRLKQAMLSDERFSLVKEGHFIKRRKVDGDVQSQLVLPPVINFPATGPLAEDITHLLDPDASVALPIALGFIDPKSGLAKNTLLELEKLWNMNWDFGGYSRYHISSEPDSPGPWPFASLFIAQAYFEAGDDQKVWRVLNWLNSLPGSQAGAWFEFYGRRQTPPCPPIGIIPWTWAEVLKFFIHHLLGIRPQWDTLSIRPRLLAEIEKIETIVRIRNIKLYLTIQKTAKTGRKGYSINNQFTARDGEEIRIKYPKDDVHIEVFI